MSGTRFIPAGPAARRRDVVFGGVAALGVALLARTARAEAPAAKTSARIVIAGAGAAGLAAAWRLSRRLDGARITIIDARREHLYQPGFTLIAAGLQPPGYSISQTRDHVPPGATLIDDSVSAFDPARNRVVTAGGQVIPYDFLVVATGLQLDYAAIAGMDTALIGRDGIGSIYAGPVQAQATGRAMAEFVDRGGVGLFTRPPTEMKCAGAPIKYTLITENYLRRRGTRSGAELIYTAPGDVLFGVPFVAEKVHTLFAERAIKPRYHHVMTAINPARKIATFSTPQGPAEIGYDFIHVVPPMRAPDAVRNSPLAWQQGPLAAGGWIEADKRTLRHVRFSNVYAVGDVAGVPKGKAAAAAKWQVPVAVDQLVSSIQGRISAASYNGYTSCPLITRVGRAILVEFDYDDRPCPTFPPGIISPVDESWAAWVVASVGLKPTYFAMLHGRV